MSAAADATPAAPALTMGGAVERFFGHYLHHTKGPLAGRAFRLEPWEREFVRDFYRVDAQGRRLFRLGILGVPRGNGKTPLAAGFGLYELMSRRDSPDVFCAAGAKDQARLIMDFARAFVESGDLLTQERVKPNRASIVYAKTNGVMRVLSSAGSLQHGLSVSAAIADEMHAFETDAQVETWTALWTALHKRENSFALAITTAGFDKLTLLGRMYDDALELPEREDRLCLRIRRDYENGVLFYWYGVPEEREDDWQNPELWRAANPASWISLEELRRQLHAPGTDEYDFKRLHLNMWTKARTAWLPVGLWSSLADETVQIPNGGDVYCGVDIGWSDDSSAVAIAHRLSDGRIVLRVKVWTTDQMGLGEFVPGGVMKLALVEEHLRELRERYNVREVAFDPKYFGRSAQDLEDEGMEMVEMPPSAAPAKAAWQGFFQLAKEHRLVHDGDKVFAAHVEACAAIRTDHGWQIGRLKGGKIDGLAAAVMATYGCELRGGASSAPQIFWLDE